jgi:uncharacterized protein (TIGR00730 family)
MTIGSVVVFGSSRTQAGDPLHHLARDLGRALAARGVEVRCGGYAGVMEALAVGVNEAGGRIVGCTIDWFADSRIANPALHEVHASPDLASRLHCLLDGTRAAIALPGGIGTLNEVFWLWTLLMHGQGEGRSLILLGEPWNELLAFVSGRFEMDPPVRSIARLASSVEEAAELACGEARE